MSADGKILPSGRRRPSPSEIDRDASLRGSIGAHVALALHGGSAQTAAARAEASERLNQRLVAAVDPDGQLPQDELAVRLVHARAAYFRSLALLSARVRRARQ